MVSELRILISLYWPTLFVYLFFFHKCCIKKYITIAFDFGLILVITKSWKDRITCSVLQIITVKRSELYRGLLGIFLLFLCHFVRNGLNIVKCIIQSRKHYIPLGSWKHNQFRPNIYKHTQGEGMCTIHRACT